MLNDDPKRTQKRNKSNIPTSEHAKDQVLLSFVTGTRDQ